MGELMLGKDNAVGKKSARSKPSLVKVGKKHIISNGRWNDDLMADYVSENGRDKYIEIGKLAGVLGANTIPNKKRVRNRLSRLFLTFLKRGQMLAVEYNGKHNAATAVKVADIKSEADHQAIIRKLDRMKSSKELSADQYEAAIAVVSAMEGEHQQAG